MKHDQLARDRRRALRVGARGRVVIHDDGYGRGKILDLSSTGVRFRIAGPLAEYRVDDRVDLELRFDGAKGGWWRMSGRIVRVAFQSQIAVAFDDVPTDFEDWIQAEMVAALEADRVVHVLLVDPVALRRGEIAAALRANGHGVREAATPLDAIALLGESLYHPRLVAIADTVPAGIADDLRAYVCVEHPNLGLLRMMAVAC